MCKEYYKLVRDLIPNIIQRDGREFEIEIMKDDEFRHALLTKLVEEAKEATRAEPEKMLSELADVFEVVDALLVAFQIERETVIEEQEKKRVARGGFERRIRLLWAEE